MARAVTPFAGHGVLARPRHERVVRLIVAGITRRGVVTGGTGGAVRHARAVILVFGQSLIGRRSGIGVSAHGKQPLSLLAVQRAFSGAQRGERLVIRGGAVRIRGTRLRRLGRDE